MEHIKQLGVLGNYQAADITSIATSWLDDPDATCSYDATKGSEGDLQSERIKKTFRKRSSVENTNNVLKQLGLEDLRVKGG